MPYRVLLSTAEAFGVVELSGAVSWADVAAALRALYLNPRWAPGAPVLWDARAVSSLRLTPSEVSPDAPCDAGTTLAALAAVRAGGRTAVVTKDVVLVSLASVVCGLGPPTGREVRTFGEVGDALAFLERPAMPEGLLTIASSATPTPPEAPLHPPPTSPQR